MRTCPPETRLLNFFKVFKTSASYEDTTQNTPNRRRIFNKNRYVLSLIRKFILFLTVMEVPHSSSSGCIRKTVAKLRTIFLNSELSLRKCYLPETEPGLSEAETEPNRLDGLWSKNEADLNNFAQKPSQLELQ